MILYIDESENENYFIVAGLLVDSPLTVQKAHRHFKKQIKNYKISDKAKEKVYVEFKSKLIDRNYYRVKQRLLGEIADLDADILYSCYAKKYPKLNQVQKESAYITLISNILSNLKCECTVVFDRFGKKDFEARIIDSANDNALVTEIYPEDSQVDPGLQFADNICSTIRLHISDDDPHNYFGIIEDMIEEI